MKKMCLMSMVLCLAATFASADPLVTVRMLVGGNSSVTVESGKTYDFTIEAKMSDVGTVNSAGTITALTAGKDGIATIGLNLFQSMSDGVEVSISSLVLDSYFSAGLSSNAGQATARGDGSNNWTGIVAQKGASATTYPWGKGIGSWATLATGTFTVTEATAGASSNLNMSYLSSSTVGISNCGTFGAVSDASLKINNGGKNISYSTTVRADPVVGYSNLQLTAVPEPMTLAMLAMGGLGLLRRKLA